MKEPHNDIASIPFEEALKELETIVRKLEEGRVSLEDAISAYERGAALKQHCDTLLKSARTKIDQIVVNADGSLTKTPSPLQETLNNGQS